MTPPAPTAELAEAFEIVNDCWGDDGPHQDRLLDILKLVRGRIHRAANMLDECHGAIQHGWDGSRFDCYVSGDPHHAAEALREIVG